MPIDKWEVRKFDEAQTVVLRNGVLFAVCTRKGKHEEDAKAIKDAFITNDVNEMMIHSITHPLPNPFCGHSTDYSYTEDSGKHTVCLLCEYKKGKPNA